MWIFSTKFALTVLLLCVLRDFGGDAVKCHLCNPCVPFDNYGTVEVCSQNGEEGYCRLSVNTNPFDNKTKVVRGCTVVAADCTNDKLNNDTYSCSCNVDECNKNCNHCFDSSIPWPTTDRPPSPGGTGGGGRNKVMIYSLLLALFFFLLG